MAQFPSQSSASGLWSLKKQKRAQQGLNWPLVSPPADDYFEYVTMLLPGNGTNGAQNNTFLDSSTNNFTITRNGNTTQGTFAPFGSNWGNYFDGTGDWLSSPTNSAFEFGSGNFTIEYWFYVNSIPSGSAVGLLSKRVDGSIYAPFNMFLSAGGVLNLYMSTSGSNWEVGPLSTTALATGTWYHVAVTRSSNTVYMFLNGTSVGSTGTLSGALVTNSAALTIGANSESPASVTRLNGYISNLRFVKGTAVYTANFTPSTTPLTAITNTSLLTCQSNRFIDNSTNALTITRNGDVSVQRFSPFSPTAPYAAGTDGGSGYFDGTGDYLTTPSSAAFNFGTGDYTIECWFNVQNQTVGTSSVLSIPDGAGDALLAYVNTNLYVYSPGVGTFNTGVSVTNTWTHVAITRSSGTLRVFVNGALTNSASDSKSWPTTSVVIGAQPTPSSFAIGYISNVRILKGTALYTSAFTPPTAPLTAITNTSLLLNFTNAGIIDNAEMNNLETVGNAQISTAQSKFGGGSMLFDGSGDYLVSNPATTNLYAFGTGDFTIEFWLYLNAGGTYLLYDSRASGAQDLSPVIYTDSGTLKYLTNNADRITGSALSTSTWLHIAVCRSGTSTRMFVNGTQAGSTYTDSNNYINSSGRPFIGGNSSTVGANSLNGYIDDLRITKGYARYTANFTPPTAPFPLY
jgi:hypothetical protein